ncbi:MAG: DNA/RNA non-specific endonuclease [Gemmatimonadaceae bacterium]|nr:DNA/RNA non-specific endonuclease [Gemmatimonadaceae bacterium]
MADPTTISDANGEWFELHNPGATAVSLTGFQVVSNNDPLVVTITGDVSIPAGGYVVLAKNTNNAVNGGLNAVFGLGAMNLANNLNDWLLVRDAGGATVDSVAWGAAPPAAASRAKRAMVIDCSPMNDARAWGNATTVYASGNRGTPNAANDVSGYTGVDLCGGGGVPGGPVASVAVTPNPSTVAIGATRAFTGTAKDAAGVTVTTTFTWASSDPAVASIDAASGVATGLRAGTTTITATAANGVSGTSVLTVAAAGEIATVTVGAATIPVGFQTQVFGTARDGTGATVLTTFTWSVDPADAARLSVDANGVITGLAAGTARVIATAPNGVSGGATVTIDVPVVADPAIYGNNTEFGTPTDASGADDFLIRRAQSTVSYNRNNGGPNWVSYNLDNGQFGAEDRCNCFTNDPAVIAAGFPVIKTSDYTNGGFDRGHMMRSADRTVTNFENATTFYLSNVVPQQADLNQGVWATQEIFIADLARVSNKELYIITGPAFTGPARYIKDEGKIRIPDFTWKIVVAMDRGKGVADVRNWDDVAAMQVIVVNMPNIAGIRTANWRDYQVTVDSLERLTGYDFLSALPDNFEAAIEAGDRPPVANISGPTSGVEGEVLAFNGLSSTDPDAGDVLTYRWTFSDGTTATGASVSKVFGDNGSVTARLTVTDRMGYEASSVQTVSISNAAPVATFGSTTGTTVAVNAGWLSQLRFTDAGLRDGPWRVRYDWGDGTAFNATLTTPPATTPLQRGKMWTKAGTYTVLVTVTDKDGGIATRTQTVTVTP